jgi:hypothetical protein
VPCVRGLNDVKRKAGTEGQGEGPGVGVGGVRQDGNVGVRCRAKRLMGNGVLYRQALDLGG